MLRKSHLLSSSVRAFDPSQQLVRSDFHFFPWGALVTIRWSKTIQFRERLVHLPAQSLLSEGLSLLFTMLLRTDRHSLGKILLSFVSRFLLIPSFCSAFVLSSRPLACRPRILFATLYRRVVHLLLLRQGYQLGLLRA